MKYDYQEISGASKAAKRSGFDNVWYDENFLKEMELEEFVMLLKGDADISDTSNYNKCLIKPMNMKLSMIKDYSNPIKIKSEKTYDFSPLLITFNNDCIIIFDI